MKQHFVNFYSPGTFLAEVTTRQIDSWNIEAATEMARCIQERHGAVPYGFCFTTRGREEDELDSREIARSPMFYLGGTIETLDDIEARNDPNDRVLLTNMRSNGYDRIIVNDNSWRWTQPLRDGDVVLEWNR